MMRYDTITVVVAGHVTEIYGPVQALRKYLENEKFSFQFISHPLRECAITHSLIENFDKGNLVSSKALKRTRRKLVSFVGDLFLNISLVFGKGRGKTIFFIGIDSINAFSGIILRKLGAVEKVVYYVIDYSPRRFGNEVLNYFYHYLDTFCAKYADYVWNISSRIAELRERQGLQRDRNMVVPVGIDCNEIRVGAFPDIKPNRFIFVSYLSADKGCQLAIEAMVEIVKHKKDVSMDIIGTGPYEKELKRLVNEYNLTNNIRFLGYMAQDVLINNLLGGGIALAPYLDNPDSFSYYADPTKVKTYLACGLPVIITKVPSIAGEIERLKMGLVIEYNKEEFISAALTLLENTDYYNQCRANALKYVAGLQWKEIYNKAFSRLH